MRSKAALVALLAVMIPACASMRKVEVGNSASTSYAVSVYNSHASTLTVSYTDPKGTAHELGTVAAGQTERFVIPGATGASVSIMGMTTAGGHYEKTATLGTTSKVTL